MYIKEINDRGIVPLNLMSSKPLGKPRPLWRVIRLFVPGLNLIVGLRQIHFLSQFWAQIKGEDVKDPFSASATPKEPMIQSLLVTPEN